MWPFKRQRPMQEPKGLTPDDFATLQRLFEKYLDQEDLKRAAEIPKTKNLIGRVSKEAAARIIMREMIDITRRKGNVSKDDDAIFTEIMMRGGLQDPYSGT